MKRVKWGLIGCGDISRKRVAPALCNSPNSELVAVSRANFDLAEPFAREFGARRWYADWRELLADTDIDAVYVATPVNLHTGQTIAAAEAGKHVLCEKPMAMNVAECDQMISACRTANVKLGVSYYRHFYPVIDRIKSVIGAGEIGQVVLAQINAFEWFNPGAAEPRAWLVKKDFAGGGPMFDFGCHRIEVLMNLFGPISRTTGLTAKVLFDRDVEDTAAALFGFEQGSFGVLTVTHAAQERQDTLDIFGSHGSLHVPVLNEGSMRIVTEAGVRSESHPPATNIHQPLIEDFIDAVLNDREPEVGGETGRSVAEIEEKVYGRN